MNETRKFYCELCGRLLVVSAKHSGFEEDNGAKVYKYSWRCPNERWWEFWGWHSRHFFFSCREPERGLLV